MTLVQLRCFLASASTGSFTAAARQLDVSQPAVAEQVRNLEQTLGIELFVRAGRGVRLTEAGVAFGDRAPAVMQALEDALGSVESIRSVHSGTLSFGLFATPEAYEIDRLAAEFARSNGGVSLRLVGQNSSVSADRVRSGELEAALVTLPIDDDGLEVQPLVRDHVVYVSADPARTRVAATIEALTERPLIVYDAESGDRDPLRRQLRDRAQELGLRLVPRIETQTMVMALRLAAAGVGDTFAPRAHTRAEYFPRGLTTAEFDPIVHETFAMIRRRGARLSPASRAFVGALERHMTTLAGLEAIRP